MIKSGVLSCFQRIISLVFFVLAGVVVAVVPVSCDGEVSRSGFEGRLLLLVFRERLCEEEEVEEQFLLT